MALILTLALDFMSPGTLYQAQLTCRDLRAAVSLRRQSLLDGFQSMLHVLARRSFPLRGKVLLNAQAALDQRCIICRGAFRGAFDKCFGVYAHCECIQAQTIGVHRLGKIDSSHFWKKGYAGYSYAARGQYYYDNVWEYPHSCVPYHQAVRSNEQISAIILPDVGYLRTTRRKRYEPLQLLRVVSSFSSRRQPSMLHRVCQCGSDSARDCVYARCGECCHKIACHRHKL